MSWFTEIAGKAEDLLNRVDQTAATALQNKSRSPSHKFKDPYLEPVSRDPTFQSFSTSALSSPQRTKSSLISSASNKPVYTPVSTLRKKPESDDEKLLRFLNDSSPEPSNRKNMEKIISEKDSSFAKAEVNTNIDSDTKRIEEVQNSDNVDLSATDREISSTSEMSSVMTVKNDDIESNTVTHQIEVCDKLMNSETSEELLGAQKRAQHAEAELKRMSRKLDHWNSQISGSDKLVRDLKDREKDMMAAIDAKDSQLAILKIRLQEADQGLTVKQNIIEELKAENEKIIKEHAENASLQNKTIEGLHEQLQETLTELNKVKESIRQSQTEYMNQRAKMEEEHRILVESYTSLQKKWNEANDRNKDLTAQMKSAKENFETLQQEYNDYKIKAQRILLTKEKLIATLKEGTFEGESLEKHEASSALLNAEVEGIKQERDLLREELRKSNELAQSFRSEIQELEKISQNDLSLSQERCKVLKEQLEMEKLQREEGFLLNTQLKEELQGLREDLLRTKSSFQSRIQDREIEIERLRRQLTAKSLSTVTQDELESRLHALTENLIQKQTIVESLSTEKNSLVLQLERLEQQLREAQNCGVQQHTYVGINAVDAERKTKSVFLENPFDSALTRRVKRVYGTIDALSIRLGVFFRRYPVARVFIFIYMLLLHFWVMIVLLTYEPEVHNSGYERVQR